MMAVVPQGGSVFASAALKYARHGWLVFPCWNPLPDGSCSCSKGADCERPGKHPLARLAPNGLLDATKDEAIVAGWWTQYPNANVAIRCGEESGLVVLDIDAYKGGMFSFEDLEARHGPIPYSIRARTGSGGGSAHVYLAHPRDGRRISSNASGKLGAGLDVKADGGYVIAPPSLHTSGGRYTWVDVDNSQIEPAPAWLLSLLGSTNGEPVSPINTGIDLPEEAAQKLADEWFARAAARVEAGAARHDTWVWFVVQMKDSAVPLEVTAKYVDEYLKLAADVGQSRSVTEKELLSALHWGYGKARRDPLPAARRALEEPQKSTEEEERASESEPGSVWINPVAMRDEMRLVAATRVPTGIPILDKATGGGLPGGSVSLFVGPVGSCKTALAVQLGIARARKAGRICYAYMPDQGGMQPLSRLAATFGNVVEDDEAFARFCAEIWPSLRVFDERLDGATLETFVKEVLSASDVGSVIIDTPQTVATKEEDDERRVIDRAMEAARRIASRITTHVLVPSHANRAATAARKKEDRTMERAAGLGSAKLEHRSQMVLFMERREGENDDDGQPRTEIDVHMAKCSYGKSGGNFRLLLDPTAWELSEISFTVDDSVEQAKAENRKVEKKSKERRGHEQAILSIVDSADPNVGVSRVRIRAEWGGRDADLAPYLALLVENGVLEPHLGPPSPTGGPRPKYYHRKEGSK